MNKQSLKVQTKVKRPARETWVLWTDPMRIMKWNAASDDWETTYAENDLRKGGKFLASMAAKDGSAGFDFAGVYTQVIENEKIEYVLDDGRKVSIRFIADNGATEIIEEFEPENIHTHDLQRDGWQAILDRFKKYAETKGRDDMLRFSTSIAAPVEIVYKTMLADQSYKEWTKVFNKKSHYVGTWDKRSTIRFLGEDDSGKIGGMVSRIKENIPAKFVSIEHLGLVTGDKEVMHGPAVESWAGALESYKFTADGSKTILEVYLDINEEHKAYFLETWPEALAVLKEICLRKNG